MKHVAKISIFLPLAVSLAGCVSSDEGGKTFESELAQVTAAKDHAAVKALPGAVASLDDILAAAALPDAPKEARVGTASYEGSFVAVNAEAAARGDFRMEANFDTEKVVGSMSNIKSTTTGDVGVYDIAGTLDLDGEITSDGLKGKLSGALDDGENQYTTEGEVLGVFRGTNADVVAGAGWLDLFIDGKYDDDLDLAFEGKKKP